MIHPTAIVDPGAELADDVQVGPFAMIEAGVRIGPGTVVHPRAHIGRGTVLGAGNVVHIGAVLGRLPDGATGSPTGVGLVAGDRNEFRENSTVVRGRPEDPTVLGNDNYIMGGARIGPGARLRNAVTVAPYVVVEAGVTIDDRAFISGLVVVREGVRIGRLAFVSGLSVVTRDAPPFMTVGGRPAVTMGPNRLGLRRAGLSEPAREALKQAYKRLFRAGDAGEEALGEIGGPGATPEVMEVVEFVRAERPALRNLEDRLLD